LYQGIGIEGSDWDGRNLRIQVRDSDTGVPLMGLVPGVVLQRIKSALLMYINANDQTPAVASAAKSHSAKRMTSREWVPI
jgi:hypothetical protein